MTPAPRWFPSWLTPTYLIDAERYVAAGLADRERYLARTEIGRGNL